MIKSSMVEWDFDYDLWSAAVAHAAKEWGYVFLAQAVDCDETTLRNWAKGIRTHENAWPNMRNFMRMTRVLDLDPRQFFCVPSSPSLSPQDDE